MTTDHYILDLEEVDATHVALVGGKGGNLGELSRIDGISVPAGFCVTTHAFRRAVRAGTDDVPDDVAAAITAALVRLGEHGAYAVRSSATAEDAPTASFAGQHDSYLNVVGAEAIVEHVRRCWASLWTERATAYRRHHGIDHRSVAMAVVVQRMVDARAAGVLFTADPATSNRRVATVEAVAGLGEALVSGVVSPDAYKVRDGAVVAAEHRHEPPVLTDTEVIALTTLGRRVEAHFGHPQDIEWCLAGGSFALVQSRPITTLFPVPDAGDDAVGVYVSVGHQQMMTDPMKALGLSMWRLLALPPMLEAGGRLYVDVAPRLASPAARAAMLALATSDPLIGDALQTVVDRGIVAPAADADADAGAGPPPGGPHPAAAIATDPAIVTGLVERTRASIAAAARTIDARSGPALLDAIATDIGELKRGIADPLSMQAIMAGMDAVRWLNEHLEAWLDEKNAADTLTQSLPDNVTAQMGLALLDVADAIRPHPEVVTFLENLGDEDLLDALPTLPGGQQAHDAIRAYLDAYGMRGAGEIDITRPRFSEQPAALVPALLTNIRSFEPGEARRRFKQGRRTARKAERAVLERVRVLPDGEHKAAEVKRMIDRARTFSGYREYPKHAIVSRTFIYKRALLREADALVEAGVLREREDAFHLTFGELAEAVRTHAVDDALIAQRRDAFRSYQALTPPRVITSEGEVVAGAYRREGLPRGALPGLAVSGGTVEGRARVVLDLAEADVGPGDILVTSCTDPSWTPVFVAVAGLVTEVGGLMTHGAVIAREYGLPAVVGVEHAATCIPDGGRIRVNGTDGYVELLD